MNQNIKINSNLNTCYYLYLDLSSSVKPEERQHQFGRESEILKQDNISSIHHQWTRGILDKPYQQNGSA